MIRKLFEKIRKDPFLFSAVMLFLMGALFRFYKLAEFVTYLGDQGRDAIIVRRILTFEHFPSIGPPTSIGQVYLGPFYYYFIAPWLALSRFDPIGLAAGVAALSSAYILIHYFITKDLFNKKVALISTLFLTFSLVLIDLSRYSWNPNLLPIFAYLSVYFLIKAGQTKKWYFFVLAGSFLSFSIQLHYFALFLLPPAAILLLRYLYENKKQIKQTISTFFLTPLFFILFSSPLLIFDLRHDFLNTKNFMKLLQSSSEVSTAKLSEFFSSFFYLNTYLFNSRLNIYLLGAILILIVVAFFSLIKKPTNIAAFLLFFVAIAVGFAFYSGPKYPHYFGVVYLIYLTVLSYFLAMLLSLRGGALLVVLFMGIFIFLNAQGYYFFFKKGNYQIEKAKRIAKPIFDAVTAEKYALTELPQRYADATYRYFLELWGKRPIEKDSLEPRTQLFVVCERPCKPIGDPQWDVAYFAPRKIIGTWRVNGVTIYQLTR